jgi:hypothetical protein
LRLLVFAGIGLLCWLDDSPIPAIAFALAWIPNNGYPIMLQRSNRWRIQQMPPAMP